MKKSNTWGILGFVFFIASGWFGYCAYDKMFNYYNPEYATHLAKNVYVGGDAYNYIINSNYTTAMSVLCIGCIIIGVMCMAVQQFRDIYLESIKPVKPIKVTQEVVEVKEEIAE